MKIGENIYTKEIITKYIDKILPKDGISPIQIKNFILRKALDLLSMDLQDEETILLIQKINKKTGDILEGKELSIDDLGLMMHPLEIEVAKMIEKSKKGEKPFDDYVPYNRRIHETPLKYLEKFYGKYLKKFNGENNYLYQFQLEKIDKKFRHNLRMWLERNNKNIIDYIPNKSDKLDKEASSIKKAPSIFNNKIKNRNKINTLKMTGRI